jgi:hypothetical protein
MKIKPLHIASLAIVGSLMVVGSAMAQQRRAPSSSYTPDTVRQRYGVQGAYDGTMLHPAGRRSTAVPVTMDDGRTGEFVIPADRRQDPHPAYYRDDQTGDMHPVRIDPRVTRQQFVQNPRAMRYQAEPKHSNRQPWEKDALIVGGGAAGGALIGAAAGGSQGAAVGAAAGGVAGLIYDLVKGKKR